MASILSRPQSVNGDQRPPSSPVKYDTLIVTPVYVYCIIASFYTSLYVLNFVEGT